MPDPHRTVIFSTDMDYLKTEVRFNEGASPQRNMAIAPPEQQFRLNGDIGPVLKLRKKLMSTYRDQLVGALRGFHPDLRAAIQEQFSMILNEFPQKAPHAYRREGGTLVNLLTGDRLSLVDLVGADARTALVRLGEMVPDDLIFLKRVGEDYKIIGGNLSFATHWHITEFLGATMSVIHSNISSPEAARRFSKMIEDVCDRTLREPSIVRRNNWFLEIDPRYPLPSFMPANYDEPIFLNARNYRRTTFLRTERQTLRGLPQSQVVVFSIQPLVFTLGQIHKDPSVAQHLLEGIKVKLIPQEGRWGFVGRVAQLMEADLSKNLRAFSTRVISSLPVNDSVHILRVEKPEGVDPVIGEAVKITLNTPNGRVSHVLSLASSPKRNYLEFAVRESNSDFKQTFKSLQPGQSVFLELTGTSLEFNLRKPVAMIAGGIGITPFRSLIQYAEDKNLKTPMWLFYGNRDHIPFDSEINEAENSNSRLAVTHVLSGGEANGHIPGRIDENFLTQAARDLPSNTVFYVVGSPQMAADVEAALRRIGIPQERISVEIFPGSEVVPGVQSEPQQGAKIFGDKDTVCLCRKVTAGAIRSAIDDGARTLEDIQSTTKAATGCGGCKCNVLKILACGIKQP